MKSSTRIQITDKNRSEKVSSATVSQTVCNCLEGPEDRASIETFEKFCQREEVKLPLFFATDISNTKSEYCGVRNFNNYLSSYKELFQKIEDFIEKKVAERTIELKEANHELDSFAYSVSHDLRAPLQIIQSYSAILSKKYIDSLDDDGKNILKGITVYSKHMSLIMDNLLNLSRLGKATISRSEVNMSNLVQEALADLKPVWGKASVEIRLMNLSPTLCDPGLLKQVWINLISNAIKYSSNSEKQPLIEIGFTEKNGEIIYYIKDNGVGFNMKFSYKLFGLFQRLHHTSEFEGTGVGLNIVFRIVSKHGGRIWAAAKENEGATFYFTLK